MPQITITEALAEIKLIDKKIAKKSEAFDSFTFRQNNFKDPNEGAGGSRKLLEQEQQSIRDLLTRKVQLRRAIADANNRITVKVADVTMTISEWLIWRRDCAPLEQQLIAKIRALVERAKHLAAQQRTSVAQSEQQAGTADIIINVDEAKLLKRSEQLEAILSGLDGQLSLRNATILIEV